MYLSVNGLSFVRGELTIPAWGIWHADLYLASSTTLPMGSAATVQIADLTATGTVVRSLSWTGQRGVRIVGGKAGWRRTVSAKQYANPQGLTAGTVITDTAKTVGETVTVTADRALGFAWTRANVPASDVLQAIAPAAWYVRLDGVTVVGPRDEGSVLQSFTAVKLDQAADILTVATENPAEWLPGKSYASPQVQGTIQRVRHMIDGMKLRTEVVGV